MALLGQALAARAGTPYQRLVEERVLGPLGIEEVWARDGPPVAQPHVRGGRTVSPWTPGAYAPAGCLRGTARGTLRLAIACLNPPPAMAGAVALALTPRARRWRMDCGLGWLRVQASRHTWVWWHGGATHGSRAYVAFAPDRDSAIAVLTNSSRSPQKAARALWTDGPA